MTFRQMSIHDLEAFFERVLGPALNASERSRRIVASIQLDSGREITGLTRDEEERVRQAMEENG